MNVRETRVTLLTVQGAVRETVEALAGQLQRADRAAIKLAEVYAQDIDARAELMEVVRDLRSTLRDLSLIPDAHGQAYALGIAVDRLTRQLAEGKILLDTGPRLLAVLESIGATPAARARIAGAKAAPAAPAAPADQPAAGQASKPPTKRSSSLAHLRAVDYGDQ